MYCFSRIVFLLTGLLIVSSNTVHAQTKTVFPPATLTLIQQELGEIPQLLLWLDAKSLRASSFYTGMANTFGSVFQKFVTSSTCVRKMKFADFDYALLLGSDLETSKERGYLTVSGSFDAPKLLQCLSVEHKWTQTREGGVIIYQQTSGTTKSTIYAAGKNAFVMFEGTWVKPVTPNGNTLLSKGELSNFATGSVLSFKYDAPTGQEVKSAEGVANAGTDLSINGAVVFHKTKTAMEYQRKMEEAKKQISTLGLPVFKNLKITRTNKRIDAEVSITTAEFVILLNFLEQAIGNKNSSPTSTPSVPTTPSPRVTPTTQP